MTVTIVEVMNNTSGVLHYENQEKDGDKPGLKFSVQPTTRTNGDGGYISTSPFHPDVVPWKSSEKKIIIIVENGPQYAVCDDWYRFSVISNGHAEKWTANFENGAAYVMRVDDHGVSFFKYEPGLRTNADGLVYLKGVPAFAQAFNDFVLNTIF